MKGDKLTREDIKEWVNNDEGLYRWWKSSRMSLNSFVKANREELERCISRVLNRPPGTSYHAMGGARPESLY